MSLLDVNNLQISFGERAVVHGISFSVAPGEKLALVGESGSGKSVTAMSLMGLVNGSRAQGEANYAGQNLLTLDPQALEKVRGDEIAVIFQEPMTALNPIYSVGFQIAEVFRIKRSMGRAQAWASAVERLRETGIPEPERRAHAYPHQLSGGQRQRAMIAMALACEPKLLLADEPTTALDVTLRLQILDLLAALQKKNGMAVLLITHDLNMVRHFADRVAVMEQGHIVEQGQVDAVFSAPAHPYTRKLINSRPVRDVVEEAKSVEAPDTKQQLARWLQGEQLRVAYRTRATGFKNWFRRIEFVALKAASFELRPGQTLGVIGESGSGKTTLAHAVLGLTRHTGQLHIDGTSWADAKRGGPAARQALRRKVQVVFQDPYASLSPRLSIGQIVAEPLRVHEPALPDASRHERVLSALAEVGLTEAEFPGLLRRFPHEFSGGQRQRIAIARALIIRPQVLVLDEPTSALDVTIQKQVLALLQKLQKEHGLSYLLITHDMDVVRAMAHQVMVMKDGDIVESGPVQQILAAPNHAYTRKLISAVWGEAPQIEAPRPRPAGSTPPIHSTPKGNRAHPIPKLTPSLNALSAVSASGS